MTLPILDLRDVTVSYAGGAPAVLGVSFSVARGECVALVGGSGCGKSTLARAIVGLLAPGARPSGSIVVDGVQVVDAPEPSLRRLRGRTVGFVTQNPFAACNPVHSVRRHVAESWRAHGERPPAGRIDDLLIRHGIDDPARRSRQRPHEWSGGMLQRASIAAACAYAPPLLIADEPTSALDADLAGGILRQLRASTSHALLLISHDLAHVREHADRLIVMDHGQIVEAGPPEQILDHPEHPSTQLLVGGQLS